MCGDTGRVVSLRESLPAPEAEPGAHKTDIRRLSGASSMLKCTCPHTSLCLAFVDDVAWDTWRWAVPMLAECMSERETAANRNAALPIWSGVSRYFGCTPESIQARAQKVGHLVATAVTHGPCNPLAVVQAIKAIPGSADILPRRALDDEARA